MAQVCRKQYNSAAELEIHLDSYDHHHRKVLLSHCIILDFTFQAVLNVFSFDCVL